MLLIVVISPNEYIPPSIYIFPPISRFPLTSISLIFVILYFCKSTSCIAGYVAQLLVIPIILERP